MRFCENGTCGKHAEHMARVKGIELETHDGKVSSSQVPVCAECLAELTAVERILKVWPLGSAEPK